MVQCALRLRTGRHRRTRCPLQSGKRKPLIDYYWTNTVVEEVSMCISTGRGHLYGPPHRPALRRAATPGSALAGRLLASSQYRVERYMQAVFAVAAAALFVPVLFHTTNVPEALASDKSPGARPRSTRCSVGRAVC